MPSCPVCGSAIISTPGRPRKFCQSSCQIKAANSRRATTRSGRLRTPEAITAPPTVKTPATAVQLLGQWFLRVDGWLAAGPMDQARAQERADAMNKETMK